VRRTLRADRFRDAATKPGEFPLNRFGATSTECARAIADAVEAAHASTSGGRVAIPAGEWHVDVPIALRSGVELHLDPGASLIFRHVPESRAYARSNRVEPSIAGIVADDCDRVAITGPGKIGTAGKLVAGVRVSPLMRFANCRDVLLHDFTIEHAMPDAVSVVLHSCAGVVIDGVEDARARGTFLHLSGRHTRAIRLVDNRCATTAPVVRPAIVLAVDVPHDALLDTDDAPASTV
jgi:polygalacturonase